MLLIHYTQGLNVDAISQSLGHLKRWLKSQTYKAVQNRSKVKCNMQVKLSVVSVNECLILTMNEKSWPQIWLVSLYSYLFPVKGTSFVWNYLIVKPRMQSEALYTKQTLRHSIIYNICRQKLKNTPWSTEKHTSWDWAWKGWCYIHFFLRGQPFNLIFHFCTLENPLKRNLLKGTHWILIFRMLNLLYVPHFFWADCMQML